MAENDVRYRFWGGMQPPQDRAQVFDLATPRQAEDATTATIRMYGPIDSWGGCWGVSAEEVAAALDSLPPSVTEIQLRINSPGGESWEGLAILNMLRAHPARVTAVVDGIAASAASFIAAGCDETVMSPGTQMMIHDAWGLSIGNPTDMRKAASFLDSVSDSIADLYVEAAGGYRAKWRALMGEETWYTAKEAVTAGLADRVDVVPDAGVTTTAGAEDPDEMTEADEPMPTEAAAALSRFDLSLFNYAGRDHAPDPKNVDDVPDEESTEDATEDAAAPEGATADSAADSADEPQDEGAHVALARAIENAAHFAFGG